MIPEWITKIAEQLPMVAICIWVIVVKDKHLEQSQKNFKEISEALNKILGALTRRGSCDSLNGCIEKI